MDGDVAVDLLLLSRTIQPHRGVIHAVVAADIALGPPLSSQISQQWHCQYPRTANFNNNPRKKSVTPTSIPIDRSLHIRMWWIDWNNSSSTSNCVIYTKYQYQSTINVFKTCNWSAINPFSKSNWKAINEKSYENIRKSSKNQSLKQHFIISDQLSFAVLMLFFTYLN